MARGSAVAALLIGLLSTGCGDDRPDAPISNAPPVQRVDAATLAECPHGGVVVRAGDDRNDNGILDDAEVTATTPACKAAPPEPPRLLTRVDALAPGAACPRGGTIVRAGLDRDGDGVLDDDEASSTETVCAPEAQPHEVIEGDVHVHDGQELRRLDGIRLITGDLVLDGSWGDALTVPDLAYVGGSVTIAVSTPTSVALPALTRVVSGLWVAEPSTITTLALPALRTVSGPLSIMKAQGLPSLRLPSLERIDGDVAIGDCDALREVDLPALVRLGGGASIYLNATLASIAAPRLTDSGGLTVSANDALHSLELPALAHATSVVIAQNPALPTLRLRLDADATVSLSDNPSLREIDVAAGRQLIVSHVAPDATIALDGTTASSSRVGIALDAAVARLTVRVRALELLYFEATTPASLDLQRRDGRPVVAAAVTIDAPIDALPALIVTDTLSLKHTRLRELATGELSELSLEQNPLLEHVTSARIRDGLGVRAVDNAALQRLTVTALDDAASKPPTWDQLELRDNPALVHAPTALQLGGVDRLVVTGNPRLEVPADWTLRGISEVVATDLPGLRTIDLSADNVGQFFVRRTGAASLRCASREGRTSLVNISDNPALVQADVTGPFNYLTFLRIQRNPVLRSLFVDKVEASSEALITGNPALPWCSAQSILDTIDADTELQEGNDDDDASCPPHP